MPSAWRPYSPDTHLASPVRCHRCQRHTRTAVGWWWRPPSGPKRQGRFESECPRCHGQDAPSAARLVPLLRLICDHCHKPFRSTRRHPFCSTACAQAERRENVEFRTKLRQDRSLDSEVFVVGLTHRPTHCPHPGCGALLDYEPGFAHCRVGCGRLWPLRGASVAAQRTFEAASGLGR